MQVVRAWRLHHRKPGRLPCACQSLCAGRCYDTRDHVVHLVPWCMQRGDLTSMCLLASETKAVIIQGCAHVSMSAICTSSAPWRAQTSAFVRELSTYLTPLRFFQMSREWWGQIWILWNFLRIYAMATLMSHSSYWQQERFLTVKGLQTVNAARRCCCTYLLIWGGLAILFRRPLEHLCHAYC